MGVCAYVHACAHVCDVMYVIHVCIYILKVPLNLTYTIIRIGLTVQKFRKEFQFFGMLVFSSLLELS